MSDLQAVPTIGSAQAPEITNDLIKQDPRVVSAVSQISAISDELKALFRERGQIINQMIYALLTGEHVLMTGIYGSSKSALGRALFGAITGAEVFSLALNKSTKTDAVFGAIDLNLYREKSILVCKAEGSLQEAQFALFDEFLDANTALLRSLNTALNERMFINGGNQQVQLPLHTAFAATNLDLAQAVKMIPDLNAVIDRFMFKSISSWLESSESRIAMYKNDDPSPTTQAKIPLKDLLYLSDIVIRQNQYKNAPDSLFMLYDEIMSEFRRAVAGETKTPPSDRFYKKLLKVPEAAALLHGRFDVIPDDFLACATALCVDGNPKYADLFLETARPKVEEAMKVMEIEQQIIPDVAILEIIENYQSQIPTDFEAMGDPKDVVEAVRKLRELHVKSMSIEPSTATGDEKKGQLISDILTAINLADAHYKSFLHDS